MKKVLIEYLTFNKIERRGLVVLLSILMLIILADSLLPLLHARDVYNDSLFRKEVAEFEKTRRTRDRQRDTAHHYRKQYDDYIPEFMEGSHLKPFPFDPNQMMVADWKNLGLSESQIRSIQKFRIKGGKFRCKADFKKMYCISSTEYEALEPFLQLPDSVARPANPSRTDFSSKEAGLMIEINSASAEDFIKLKGIGAYLAGKIVEYRSALGGYRSIDQLKEVKHLDSARFEGIRNHLRVNPNAIHKKNVNTASFEELSAHPYIGYNIALSLTNYRQVHGKFEKLEDLKKTALITEKVYQKIAPYLRVD
jgi:competence ComEA-like helix-hairpin-helix protein